MNYKTEQEKFWSGEFGDKYNKRNKEGRKRVASNAFLFSKILSKTTEVESILEFGANVGINISAIKTVLPEVKLSAIEINDKAIKVLSDKIDNGKVYHQSILDFEVDYRRDFVFTKGVLIHINPEYLNEVYTKLYDSTNKYILIAEYYNPTPVDILYRGNKGFLFKRDFAGELLNKYPDLELIDYGFAYHGDTNYPQDDLTWFLLKKK